MHFPRIWAKSHLEIYGTRRRYVPRIKIVFIFSLVARPQKEKLSIERQMSLMRACHRQKKLRTEKLPVGWKRSRKRSGFFFFLFSSFLPVTSDHPCKHPSATWQPFRKKVWPKARYLACGQSFRRRLVSSPRHSLSAAPPHTLIFEFLFYTANGGQMGPYNGWSFAEIDIQQYSLSVIHLAADSPGSSLRCVHIKI